MEKYRCKICDNTQQNKDFIVKEMMYGLKEEFIYFQCASCGCLQITEPPQNLSKYYDIETYYSFQNISKNKLKTFLKFFIAISYLNKINIFKYTGLPYYKNNISLWKKLRTIKKTSSILDVGCGNGHLLQEMYTWGYKNLTGLDNFIKNDILYPSGIKIFKKDIFRHVKKYDFIMLHHSFEHMDTPHNVMKQLFAMLNPNGQLLIRIPLSDSYAWRKYGTDWFQIDAPRHFFLHTIKSMSILALESNFILEEVYYDSQYKQFTNSYKYSKGISLYETMELSTDFIKACKKQTKILNKLRDGDQACFYFKKRELE